jgi:4-hydroxy-2-oxoglutarate aldolase
MSATTIRTRLRGIIPACVTPMTAGDELDHVGLAANLRAWSETDLSGFLLLGSTGEVVMLSEFEQALVLEVGRRAIPAGKLLLAGCGQQSTRGTIVACQNAARAGADAVLVMPHFYFKGAMTPAVLADHFRAVADGSPLPVLLYSVPQFTGVPLPPETVARLAEHPNIVGIKDSAGDARVLDLTRRLTPPDFRILTGAVHLVLPALGAGMADGAILAAANVAWEPALAVEAAMRRGELAAARTAHRRLMEVSDVVGRYGIGGWKAGLQARGLVGGLPRPPLPQADEQARAQIAAVLATAELDPVRR